MENERDIALALLNLKQLPKENDLSTKDSFSSNNDSNVNEVLKLLNLKYKVHDNESLISNTITYKPTGEELVGYRIEVFWPAEKTWYPGTIMEYCVSLWANRQRIERNLFILK